MVKKLPFTQNTSSFVLNQFSEHIEKASPQSYLPQRSNQSKNNSAKNSMKPSNVLSRVMFWSVALAVGGLAIYFYNQSSAIDLNTFLNLGDIYR